MDAERLDIEKLLDYLTLEEKLRLLSGDGMWHTFGAGELPRVRMSDGPNGLRMTESIMSSAVPATCFPTPTMLANSWDPAMIYSVGVGLGREATAMGVNLLLGPGLNIKRSPFCGRNFEYFSEDPLLAGELGKAYISGVQATGVGACVKHFAANNQENKRMISDSLVDERALREIYLKPFELALKAKPAAVMCAYNKVNGYWCAENEYLLTKVLRDDWGYDGVAVSDWGAVRDRATSLAAGLDLAMPDSVYGLFEQQLAEAYDAGRITDAHIERSLRRILTMTDDVYLEPYGDFDADAHDRLAYSAAAASVVLLKNENGFLPITRGMKIAVMGELATNAPIQGGGSSHVSALKELTPLEAFGARGIEVSYFPGYSSDPKLSDKYLREALAAAADFDAVVVYVGQPAPAEGADRTTLALPAEQNKLIAELTAAGHRTVVVLCSIGPVLMPWVNRVRAIIYAGLNGQNGALAAADVLYGRINPCGKLAESFPIDEANVSDFGGDAVRYRESIYVGYRYYDAANKRVLFPFGHGKSFCDISYDSMRIKRTGGNEFDATVTLTNKSVRDAFETVQIYVSDKTRRVPCEVKKLAGFTKAFVEGQTTTEITVHIKSDAFAFYDVDAGRFSIPDGEFEIMAAASADDIRHTAAVKVDGDFRGEKQTAAGYALPLGEISDADFEAMYGAPVPVPPTAPKKGEFTVSCSFDDIKKTFIGRIMRRLIFRWAKKEGPPGSPEYMSYINTLLYEPLSSLSSMSSGAMPLSRAKGIIEMANGHFFAGLKLMLKKKGK